MTRPWWDEAPAARSRAFTWRGAVTVALGLALLALSVAVAVAGTNRPGPSVTAGVETHAVTAAQIAAGCTPAEKVVEPFTTSTWVDSDRLLPYQTTVPVAGWFFRDPPTGADPSPAPESVLRALWSGRRAAWYTPGTDPHLVSELRELAATHPQWGLDVWAWPAGRGNLPDGSISFATWSATITCTSVDAGVVADLWELGGAAPGGRGEQPVPFERSGT